jgi:hypothetical protein
LGGGVGIYVKNSTQLKDYLSTKLSTGSRCGWF